MMKGTVDCNYFHISRSTLSREKYTDTFSCPAITFRQNQAGVKLDSLYYDRKYFQSALDILQLSLEGESYIV